MNRRLLGFKFVALAFIFLILASAAVSAQEKAVERVRRLYEEIGKKIELSENGTEDSPIAGIFCSELIVNKNGHVWPVVGNYELAYKFYYDLAHTEGHEYPDRLRKVVMKSSMSARSYYEEYLFDELGFLVFYFTKPNEPPIGDEPQRDEQRIYFAAGRPIRIVNGQKINDRLTAKDAALARRVLITSNQIKKFFSGSLTLANE